MKGYKAFKKGMICNPTGTNPIQYKENTVYEQNEEAKNCTSGNSARIGSSGNSAQIISTGDVSTTL